MNTPTTQVSKDLAALLTEAIKGISPDKQAVTADAVTKIVQKVTARYAWPLGYLPNQLKVEYIHYMAELSLLVSLILQRQYPSMLVSDCNDFARILVQNVHSCNPVSRAIFSFYQKISQGCNWDVLPEEISVILAAIPYDPLLYFYSPAIFNEGEICGKWKRKLESLPEGAPYHDIPELDMAYVYYGFVELAKDVRLYQIARAFTTHYSCRPGSSLFTRDNLSAALAHMQKLHCSLHCGQPTESVQP